MSTRAPKWISTLLRAKTIKEDQAKEELGRARRAQQTATAHAIAERRRAAAMHADGTLSTPNFLAMVAARSAATATALQAQHTAERLGLVADQALGSLVDAAKGRRTAEILVEREVAAATKHEQAVAGKEMDEIAATRHRATHPVDTTDTP